MAILMMTVLVKILLFPLLNQSFSAMSKMRKLQPKMKEIQERFAADKTRQQQEMMQLYQKEKVNPLAGCLPILIQIPNHVRAVQGADGDDRIASRAVPVDSRSVGARSADAWQSVRSDQFQRRIDPCPRLFPWHRHVGDHLWHHDVRLAGHVRFSRRTPRRR
ncbi:MAG: membrane protein insertase YidC [Alphaproteobacteria bacterium]